MFNQYLKNDCMMNLEAAINKYEIEKSKTIKASEELFNLRNSCLNTILSFETYISKLANAPKEFNKTISEFYAEYQEFQSLIKEFQRRDSENAKKASTSAGMGIGLAVGVAALAPTAAMAVATTFGVASTGTAIASLTGAAATNAALAWLGGGALAAGGGGIAGGSTLLALAGPVGWIIGGVALAGSAAYYSVKNAEIAEKCNQDRRAILADTANLRTGLQEISRLYTLTLQEKQGIQSMLNQLTGKTSDNYLEFSSDQKSLLASAVNHVRILSSLLNKKAI